MLGHQLGLLLCSLNSFPRVCASAKTAAMALSDWQVSPVGSGTQEQRIFEGKLYLLIFDRTGSDEQTEDATLAARTCYRCFPPLHPILGARGETSARIRPYH